MEDFKNRLLAFIEGHCKMKVRAFERACGLTNGTIGTIGAKGPGAEIVQRISYTFPELDLNWLFRGVGKMIIEELPADENNGKGQPIHPINDIHGCDQVNITCVATLKDFIRIIKRELIEDKDL